MANRIIGYQKDLLGAPEVPVWSAGRPPKAKRESAKPGARKRDPGTSKAAAEAAQALQVRHQARIFRCLKTVGPLGKDGIADLLGISGVAVARRLKEMQMLDLVKLTGRKVKSAAGRDEREWEACAS